MLNRRATQILATGLIAAAAGVALAALWASKRQPASAQTEAFDRERFDDIATAPHAPLVVLPPGDESSFADQPALTAVPRVASYRLAGADDYESISPDELSAAFLSRATESWSELESELEADELGADAELDGFQITTIETLTMPELNDDPADFDIPEDRRERV
jgi:hypothetical protein